MTALARKLAPKEASVVTDRTYEPQATNTNQNEGAAATVAGNCSNMTGTKPGRLVYRHVSEDQRNDAHEKGKTIERKHHGQHGETNNEVSRMSGRFT